jgi:hypothetical protein
LLHYNAKSVHILSKYNVDRNVPLPTGEPVEKINDEAYPEAYYNYKGTREEKRIEKHQHKKKTRKPRLVSRYKVEADTEDDNDSKRHSITAKSIANMIN